MAIDFTLTPQQRELQLESRRFAAEVLAGARAAELLPTAEERFLATRPMYEAMVVAGFLRKCIPQPAGGENAGLIDTAIMAEEFYSVNASVTLTMLGTVLGLLPILLGGTPEQCGRLLAVGRLLRQRTGRKRQRRFSAARRRRAYLCRASRRPLGHQWPEEMGLVGDRVGS
jgi:alkylation response protein AidB-like acyl-CoA dehydrogenase